MTGIERRALLAGIATAGGVTVAGCASSNSSSDGNQTRPGGQDEQADRTVVDRTLAPGSDGNPATVSLDADEGTVLRVDLAYENAAVFDLFGSAGLSLASGGTGAVYEQASQVTADPVPAGGQPTLAVAMHSEDRADVTATVVDQSEPSAAPSSPGTALREQIGAVSQAFGPDSGGGGFQVSGPLWLRLFDQKLQLVTGQAAGPAQRALATAQQTVYGGLVRQRATTWVDEQVEQLAGLTATALVTLVSAKTGLPAGIIQGPLESELESVLDGGGVTWSYSDPEPRSLSATGGEVSLVATGEMELSVRGFGLQVEAPVQLTGTADGQQIPASAAIDDFQMLVDRAVVELL